MFKFWMDPEPNSLAWMESARGEGARHTPRVCKPGKKSPSPFAYTCLFRFAICHLFYLFFFPTPFELPHFHARESLVVKIHAC